MNKQKKQKHPESLGRLWFQPMVAIIHKKWTHFQAYSKHNKIWTDSDQVKSYWMLPILPQITQTQSSRFVASSRICFLALGLSMECIILTMIAIVKCFDQMMTLISADSVQFLLRHASLPCAMGYASCMHLNELRLENNKFWFRILNDTCSCCLHYIFKSNHFTHIIDISFDFVSNNQIHNINTSQYYQNKIINLKTWTTLRFIVLFSNALSQNETARMN